MNKVKMKPSKLKQKIRREGLKNLFQEFFQCRAIIFFFVLKIGFSPIQSSNRPENRIVLEIAKSILPSTSFKLKKIIIKLNN
jgi:hypothetical protein